MTLEWNTVYAVGPEIGPGQRLRVLFTEDAGVHVINVHAKHAEAYLMTREDAMSLRWDAIVDPWLSLRATHDDEISPLNLARRDRAFQGLRRLCALARDNAPAGIHPHLYLLRRKHRFPLITAAATLLNLQRNSIRRWLIRWWVRGMNRNAMLPDFVTMSGAGRTRAIPAEACDSLGNPFDASFHKKRGRPSGNGTRLGTVMTAPVRASIETLGRELYLEYKQNSVSGTYHLWKIRPKDIAPRRYPTPQMFYSVLVEDPAVRAEIRQRALVGRKPRGGNAESDAMYTRVPGPGFCFQGDSTPLSRIKVEGKIPTLYFTSDTYTSGIAGYHVYTGRPSTEDHSKCLAQAAFDKPTHCRFYNIIISEEQWPMAVIPEAWVADRGELIGPIADYFISSFDIALQNTPPYSPQLKADVEAAFGAMLRNLISRLDSHVTPRPGRRYSDTVQLTMHELHVLIILFILEYNSRKLPRIPTPSQTIRKVEMSPIGLWNKEFDRINGEGRTFSPHELLLVTTKRGKAALDEAGLSLEGLTYICPENGVRAYQSDLGGRRRVVAIHYDEDVTDRIFIQRKELHRLGVATIGLKHEFIECPLSERDAAWAGHTFAEFREAYKQHTEDTQGLYEKADAANAALGEAIIRQNAQPTAKTKGDSLNDAPEAATAQDSAAADLPPERTANLPARSCPPKPINVLSGAGFEALKTVRQRRTSSN